MFWSVNGMLLLLGSESITKRKRGPSGKCLSSLEGQETVVVPSQISHFPSEGLFNANPLSLGCCLAESDYSVLGKPLRGASGKPPPPYTLSWALRECVMVEIPKALHARKQVIIVRFNQLLHDWCMIHQFSPFDFYPIFLLYDEYFEFRLNY